MPHILFVHLSVDGHLGCFHFLAVVNNAAGTICVCLCGHTFSIPLSSYPGLNSLVHIWRTARLMSFSLPPSFSTRWGVGAVERGFEESCVWPCRWRVAPTPQVEWELRAALLGGSGAGQGVLCETQACPTRTLCLWAPPLSGEVTHCL